MHAYCRTIDATAPSRPCWSEDDFVKVWLLALETTNDNPSLYDEALIQQKKLQLQFKSLFLTTCYLFVEEHHLENLVRMRWQDEEMMLNILNDTVVVHHNHYTLSVYGPAHKLCNSTRQVTKSFTTNVYAHNATSFNNNFIIKSINIALFTFRGDPMPQLKILRETTE